MVNEKPGNDNENELEELAKLTSVSLEFPDTEKDIEAQFGEEALSTYKDSYKRLFDLYASRGYDEEIASHCAKSGAQVATWVRFG